jgi:hypothetical protein
MHFKAVKLTSVEELGKSSNQELHGSRDLIKRSNIELKKLVKELESQRLEKDDLRYEVFQQIYDILQDDIEFRLSLNLKLEAIHELNNRKLQSIPQTTLGESLTGLKKGGLTFLTPEGDPNEFERRRSVRQL